MRNMDLFDGDIINLEHLQWTLGRATPGTAGTFLKAYEVVNNIKHYYKMSNYDSVRGVFGHECINEIVAQNIAEYLNIEHLHYELVHCNISVNDTRYNTFVTRSCDFKNVGERVLTLESYYNLFRNDKETPLEFMLRKFEDYVYEVFLFDYIICNRDRHGANIEILYNGGGYRVAPIFDNGLSFLFSCYNDGNTMEEFDYLKEGPVNNFLGSNNLVNNLKLVPKSKIMDLKIPDRSIVFKGLEDCKSAVPQEYWDCVYTMVEKRFQYVKKISHS